MLWQCDDRERERGRDKLAREAKKRERREKRKTWMKGSVRTLIGFLYSVSQVDIEIMESKSTKRGKKTRLRRHCNHQERKSGSC